MVKFLADYYRDKANGFRRRAAIADALDRSRWLQLADGFEELAGDLDPSPSGIGLRRWRGDGAGRAGKP